MTARLPSEGKTPLTDALEEHGSKYYKHPRYDKKVLALCRRFEAGHATLVDALEMAAWRWRDLASAIRQHGKYDNDGFCDATADRCFAAITAAKELK